MDSKFCRTYQEIDDYITAFLDERRAHCEALGIGLALRQGEFGECYDELLAPTVEDGYIYVVTIGGKEPEQESRDGVMHYSIKRRKVI